MPTGTEYEGWAWDHHDNCIWLLSIVRGVLLLVTIVLYVDIILLSLRFAETYQCFTQLMHITIVS